MVIAMTILAVCGPIGSDYKRLGEQCYARLDTETTALIDGSTFESIDSLLRVLEEAKGDVIVFGSNLFLHEKLRSAFDVKVFVELDADLCLSNYLKSADKSLNLEQRLSYYLNHIKPLNETINISAKFADLRRPQAGLNDRIIDLLVNEEQFLSKPKRRNMFWESAPQMQSRDENEKTDTVELSQTGMKQV